VTTPPEVADGAIAADDSKDPDGPVPVFGWPAWRAFINDEKMGAPGIRQRLRGLWLE
jgi:hypothetical protein